MLKPVPFANAIAATTAVLTVFLWALRFVLPPFFTFFFNAQFFGADVASLLPKDISLLLMLAEFVALLAGAWGIGFLWAVLYNKFAK
ncbi:MAG TPA: hypothetical protein VIG89_07015 [Candidatus Acidoferrales bacterium]